MPSGKLSQLLLLALATLVVSQDDTGCSTGLMQQCQICEAQPSNYTCSLPGLETFTPGQYEGVTVNYLNIVTEASSPHFPARAKEFEACTGGKILFSDAASVWDDPVNDLGSRDRRGNELYDAYFMSYAHFPGFAELGLAETLNERIRQDNARIQYEDIMPTVRNLMEYHRDGETDINFVMFDADALVPIVRIDLLEQFNFALPNTWEELTEIVDFFHGKDLNDDGEPDFGICFFPINGDFEDDWWPVATIYSTWASTDQLEGTSQGFYFNTETFEPRLSKGFEFAIKVWENLFKKGLPAESSAFIDGRCAIGFGPPGSWKRVFLRGVSRRDENNTVVWEPKMKTGEYAEPYRFKTFGSSNVVDRESGELVPCTRELCPNAEIVPPYGHHGDTDRAKVLRQSPLEGQLVNRAPLFWTGCLGTMIRESSEPIKKDLMWDFLVYTNSPDTSAYDVARVSSWMDSWRYSQLGNGENFLLGGWSKQAFDEHSAIQRWAAGTGSNAAVDIIIPGISEYSRDVMFRQVRRHFQGELSVDELIGNVTDAWNVISDRRDKLDQLQIYRAALGLDTLSEFKRCELHRDLMDKHDPSVCRKFDPIESSDVIIAMIVISVATLVGIFGALLFFDRRRQRQYEKGRKLGAERDEIREIEGLISADNFRVEATRVIIWILILFFGIFMSMWAYRLVEKSPGDQDSKTFVYVLVASFVVNFLAFLLYDYFVRVRNKKLVVNAAQSSEVVTSLFPGQVRDKVLGETKSGQKAATKSKLIDAQPEAVLAELYPRTTILFADISGFTSWSSSRTPAQVFCLLETVFGALDTLAMKSGVYKVETVGDCYVAITGLPQEQPDHCQRMCRFAFRCLKVFRTEIKVLKMRLGPDTGELRLRMGIHTGQVTAGVLRGVRARFSLFGDAVNVTARMETTSIPGKIQLSKEAAEALTAAGKEWWIRKRLDTVVAKGKGLLDTYWLCAVDNNDEVSEVGSTSLSQSLRDEEAGVLLQSDSSLIEWNVEILLGLIRKLVAVRQYRTGSSRSLLSISKTTFNLPPGSTFLNEFKEIIELPQARFDISEVDLSAATIPAVVVSELRELVKAIARMYNHNPFHNFEHASHVTMSVAKLLSRVVKPIRFSSEMQSSELDHSFGITSDPLTQLACAFSALVHDANHPGVPNVQLIKENPELADRFHGRSVAEQCSLFMTLDLFSDEKFRNLHDILFTSTREQQRFRALVVNSVLATDIVDKDLKALRNKRWEKAFSEEASQGENRLDAINRKATIVIEHLIQASDVAHTMQHWTIYLKWNERLFQEMYQAFKHGRSSVDPSTNWAAGEIGFFDYYIIPLAKKLKECQVFGVSSDEYLNYAMANRTKWEVEGATIVEEMIGRLNRQGSLMADATMLKDIPEYSSSSDTLVDSSDSKGLYQSDAC